MAWQPSKPLNGGVAPTSFSVAGKTVATRQFLTRAPNSTPAEYGWAEQGGDALNLVQAIYEKWAGILVISGGGVTDTIPFDEEKMGGASELVLFACGHRTLELINLGARPTRSVSRDISHELLAAGRRRKMQTSCF